MKTNHSKWAQLHTWNEILSQAEVWKSVLKILRQSAPADRIINGSPDQREWLFIGCGTSFYLAEAAALSWTLLTGLPARAIPASEILLFPRLLTTASNQMQAVVISRSGRTSEAVRAARVLGEKLQIATLGITCARNSDVLLFLFCFLLRVPLHPMSTLFPYSRSSMAAGVCTSGSYGIKSQTSS